MATSTTRGWGRVHYSTSPGERTSTRYGVLNPEHGTPPPRPDCCVEKYVHDEQNCSWDWAPTHNNVLPWMLVRPPHHREHH
eukprot:1130030-Pyramimonas_sp.AAC.1